MQSVIKLLPSILCILIAAFLMNADKGGWGWFLFAGFCLGGIALDGINKITRDGEDI